MTADEWARIQQEPWFKKRIKPIDELLAEIDKAWKEAAEIVDNRPLFTLVVGGTSRKEDFGADDLKIALRGAYLKHTFNAEWSQKEGLMGAPDPTVFKVGWMYSTFLFQGAISKDGAELSAGASYETFDDVPDAAHSTQSKVFAKLEIPLREGMTLPLSVTWANHEDLLSDDDEIVGHFGINVDFGSLWKKDEN